MDFVCKLCMNKVKYDVLASIRSLTYGDKDFYDILSEVSAIYVTDLKITHVCQSCVNSVQSFYDYRNNLRKNLRVQENEITNSLNEFLKKSSEEISLINLNECLVIAPKSNVDDILLMKHMKNTIKIPKLSIERLDIIFTQDDSNNDKKEDEENNYDLISVKIEPNVEINDDSGFSTDRSNKWSLNDLSTQEKLFISENIQLSRRKSFQGTRSAKCKICNKTFKHKQKTYAHIKRDHLMKKGSKLQKWIKQKISQGRININGQSYKCVICEKTDTTIVFDKAFYLRNHLMEHKKSSNFYTVLEDEADASFDATSKGYDHPFGFLVS